METVLIEEAFRGVNSDGDSTDTVHVYNPLCDARSGLSSTVTDITIIFLVWVLFTWPLISMPLGEAHVISGSAKSATGFVTVQMME